MLLLEVANDVYSSQDEGGVVQSICPSPLYGAQAFGPLHNKKLIKPTTSESHFYRLNISVSIAPSMFAAKWLQWKPISTILFPGIYLIQKAMVTMGVERLVNCYEYLKLIHHIMLQTYSPGKGLIVNHR